MRMQRPSLAAVRPDLAGQWHPARNAPLTPAHVTPGSGKRVWWLDELGHEWESTVNNRNNGTGCPFCAGNRVLTGFNDLATRAPNIAAEWHPTKNGGLTTDLVAASGGRKYWWQCEDRHEWQMTVGNRTFGDQGCPVCAGQRVLAGENDMATTAPGLAAEWHPSRNAPLTPKQRGPQGDTETDHGTSRHRRPRWWRPTTVSGNVSRTGVSKDAPLIIRLRLLREREWAFSLSMSPAAAQLPSRVTGRSRRRSAPDRRGNLLMEERRLAAIGWPQL